MFPRLDNGPASQLYIRRPGYDPLIEHHACGAGAPASGRNSVRSDRDDVGIVPAPGWHHAAGPTSNRPRAASALVATACRERRTHGRRQTRGGANTHSPRCQDPLV